MTLEKKLAFAGLSDLKPEMIEAIKVKILRGELLFPGIGDALIQALTPGFESDMADAMLYASGWKPEWKPKVKIGGMGERLIPSDCKSDAFGLRRFKSSSPHQK